MAQSEPHIHLLDLLDGLRFPATKSDIILHAERRGASEDALDQLQAIPEDDYANRGELLDALDTIEDLPGHENLWSSAESADLYKSEEDPPPGEDDDIVFR